MHLGMSKSKNSTSLYVLKSTYENGFHSTKIVEKLGTVEELSKKLNGEDPIVWAKKYISDLNKQEKDDKHEVTAKYSPVKIIKKDEQRYFNGGYFFLQKIYGELGFHDICNELKKKHKFDYDFDSVFSRLIFSRIIYPSANLSYYDSACMFIEPPSFTPLQVAKALKVLAVEEECIRTRIFENIQKFVGIDYTNLHYDSTICLYEPSRRKNRSVPIIPIEIYTDGNMIPLTYRINPEHLDHLEQNQIEDKIQRLYRHQPVTSTTDGGLISNSSKKFKDWGNKNSYIVSLVYSQLRDSEKNYVAEPNGWIRSDTHEVCNIEELRITDEVKNPSRYYYKEIKTNNQRTIITYSIYNVEQSRLLHEARLSSFSNTPTLESIGAEIINTNHPFSNGIRAFVTNINSPVSEIVNIAKIREISHRALRVFSMEIPNKGAVLSSREQLNAHFITCFSALVVYSVFLKDYKLLYQAEESLSQLRAMNFMKIRSEGYVPLYTRNNLTDHLHECSGFRTDYEIINARQMKKLFKLGKK